MYGQPEDVIERPVKPIRCLACGSRCRMDMIGRFCIECTRPVQLTIGAANGAVRSPPQ